MTSSTHNNSDQSGINDNQPKLFNRRDILKALAGIPFIGAFIYALFEKQLHEKKIEQQIFDVVDIQDTSPGVVRNEPVGLGEQLNIGIIGFGFRGEQLARAAGFAHPDWIEEQKEAYRKNKKDTTLQEYYDQADLNIKITAISDVFDVRTNRGLTASRNKSATHYIDYREMLANDKVDAVIIATPDHWHAQMAIDAANAGKHVYLEKCMTKTIDEAFALRDAIKNNRVVFQLGHSGRQNISYQKARQVIQKDILGPITLIETYTNRNNDFAAWIWPIHEQANEQTIDWNRFIGSAPDHPFSLERFFRWRMWWDYGTGMAGDLLTHEFDAINQIMELGIPSSAIASGGIYYFHDGRTVPDVFNVSYEYPGRTLTLSYAGTLANGEPRSKLFMGHDGAMEVGRDLTVSVDPQSTRYKQQIESGIVDPSLPLLKYTPGQQSLDAITSATAKYFADRGLTYTYRNGKRVNSTTLHIQEWLNAIRFGGPTSCNIDQGFQEAITAHMATKSFQEGRRVTWDPVNERVV